MLPKLSDATQTISFSEGDGVCSVEVYATDVVVNSNAGNHDHGSSKVKLKNLVDYNWEPKFYSGQLLAVHMSGKYLAYCIKAPNAVNPGTWTGMVRVVYNPEPATDKRALIKGMKGEVQDLAFAHVQNEVVLACIDEQGNFYVHEIEVTDTGLRCTLLVEVRDEAGAPDAGHRVVWCPYIPDEDDDAPDEDVAKLLLTTHGNVARMWNIRAVMAEAGAGGVARAGSLGAGGCRSALGHAARLVAAAFSPDGTALATAAADGYVMFFQVYMNNDSSPRCLHKWQPHGGKPLSCLFFLDNHNNYNTDVQFWKFAVTGADNNTLIKVWSCKSWSCLQSIALGAAPGALAAALDRSASYLVLAGAAARSLLVLRMARDPRDERAYCNNIAEFLLPFPVLSFCIVDAEEQQPKCESSCDDPFHRNGSGDDGTDSPDHFEMHHHEEAGGARVSLRLYIVQPKGLQEGRLQYAAPPPALLHGMSELSLEEKLSESGGGGGCSASPLAASILQQQTQQLKNMLCRAQPASSSLAPRPDSPSAAPQLNLMTPDAFSSPGKREDEDPPLASTPDVSGVKSRSSTSGAAAGAEAAAGKLTSGGSSPSREVQQIMAQDYYKDHMDEEPCEEVQVEEAAAAVTNGNDVIYDDIFDATDDDVSHKIHTGSETSWPGVPLPGGAARALEPLTRALQHELAAKLSATDTLLRENIDKLVTSKSVMDRLSASVSRAVAELVKESLRAALGESVVPAMERAHAQLFKQINHSFQMGTKEFAAQTEAAGRLAAERGGAAAAASLRAALERHAELLAAAPPLAPHQLSAVLADAARDVLEKEMSWWREQARAVASQMQMSRAHSPSTPSVADRQIQVAQIQSLMSAGDVNGAFQLALSASDLALVVVACRCADPAAVFGPPCKLKQHVLLSLVQQLAADMSKDTVLKHRYLEEAVMNLDTLSPVTREHLPGVVRELQKQILSFVQAQPHHALARPFRMLLMASEALLKGSA